jgi:hypothetical protein
MTWELLFMILRVILTIVEIILRLLGLYGLADRIVELIIKLQKRTK